MSDVAPPRAFRRRGLGRGLDALLTSETEAEEGSPLISVDPRMVTPNPEQPRRAFEPDALAALGDSIRLHGLLHPIVIQRATRLAIETNHHLFDTLHHAVALEHENAVLVTADDRYYGKAERYEAITALRDWGGVP